MRTEKDFNRAGFYISIPVEEVESFRKQKKRSLSLLKVRPGSLYLFRLWVSGRNKLTLTILKIIEALFYQAAKVARNPFESDLIRSVIGVENPRPPLNLSAAKLNSTNVNNCWKQMNDIFTTFVYFQWGICLSHDVVTSDVESNVSTAYCAPSSLIPIMSLARVVETLVTTTVHSPSRDYSHPHDQTTWLMENTHRKALWGAILVFQGYIKIRKS